MRRAIRLLAIVLGFCVVIGFAASAYELLRTYIVTYQLGKLTPADTQEIPHVVERLRDYNYYVRFAAAKALLYMGPTANKEAYPALVRTLKDPVPHVRAQAASSLTHYTLDASVIHILIDGLDDEDFMVRLTFLWLLAQNAKIADAAIPKFTELLDNPSKSGVAAKALGEIGPPAKAAVPKIIAVMGTRNDSTRLDFIHALEKFGPDAQAAIPDLQQLTQDPDPQISQAAAKAVQAISAPAQVVPQK